ncbi:MAG: zf-HC2 domain-containing protein [Elusimicrobiota bacterium]|jgi:anti-sigma factor (TIGR02949 family)
MIRCDQVRASLEAYYDHECVPEERQALETHLATCPTCREELDQWVHLSTELFPDQTVQAPPFLWTRVLAGIEDREALQKDPWWVQWRWMSQITAAASLFVILTSAYYFQTATPSLDTLLEGGTTQQEAIQLVSAVTTNPNHTGLVLGGESWVEN